MTQPKAAARYRGVFPVVPTIFDATGALDLAGQLRCVDFMIDAGSNGLCILANFSEQFALSDDERERLTRAILEHVDGRVPVIVTTTHFSSQVCAARSRAAQEAGAAMVMVMPPYHGATIRIGEAGIRTFFQRVSDAITIPVMIQDAPVSGTTLSAAFLARLANEVERVSYFKIEVPQAAAKLRELIALGGDAIEGPWDGEEAITLHADLEAGATGSMTGGGYPDGIRRIVDAWFAGDVETATRHYQEWLPLINCENRQGGLATAKALMKEGGIIASDAVREPFAPMHPETRASLLRIARRLDPLVLRWAR
ncbi:dihydrodipicolinate synthase family protein [Paraburkholderia caballeronis]|uniref:2-dehydro-3-deoxy-L-arabinonate dehydratase n=1 Tax=Paraburkholderia caballeronis TaxID=416943 RepID=A0A1H7NYT1_9BURK|nr:dihydrodipicolinate synthase family protein [Paraburkholderia caballeronis]PXW25471.1 2-dehydro-3-deoxy-L-arabinonate dehydratase [Paraburkholderia caballeronis]PXX01078.1 2-dehydro-3-deoxy-L-arabinonate dehydratase [Paraburkholderia caballeronis]RAJ99569.1 2-dehydro-3-deoxy-L-arabinonate dehydratase [Paraburkholderia caballeronis]TDV11452.1 2-dehydro-3-deoxy-L-arabinonate dehydratase [Paraburkholderia caballeronis]TDV14642.1 2-dehydro-3-deoxy-L-arabinonate dehydratase [Paraburkholderia cab